MNLAEIDMHLNECISRHSSLAQQVAKFMRRVSCDTQLTNLK